MTEEEKVERIKGMVDQLNQELNRPRAMNSPDHYDLQKTNVGHHFIHDFCNGKIALRVITKSQPSIIRTGMYVDGHAKTISPKLTIDEMLIYMDGMVKGMELKRRGNIFLI